MKTNQSNSFGDRFASKLQEHVGYDTTEGYNEEPWFDIGQDDGFASILVTEFANETIDPKELIQLVLDNCVDNVESMVDTVDVFHLIAAHRDLPSLSDAVPFELAQYVGYTYDEYVAMCDDMDERLNEVLETAIDQMIGTVAAENICF